MSSRVSVAVCAALMLAGCGKAPPVSVENATAATIANIEAQADALEAKAADEVNGADARELDNAAAAFEASERGNVGAVTNTD